MSTYNFNLHDRAGTFASKVKQHEAEADKDEQVMKRRKLSETCQLTLKELKDPWRYDNSEHKKSDAMDSGDDGSRFTAVFYRGRYRLCPIDG